MAAIRRQNCQTGPENAVEAGKAIPSAKDGHTLSHEAMKICYSALSCFYDYLTDEGYAFGNPIPAIRKQSPFLIKGVTSKSIKRLSDLQWDYVLDCAALAADKDPAYERMLFTVAMLKTLYLRVSELSDRANWQPVWKHFWLKHFDLLIHPKPKAPRVEQLELPDP